MSKKPRNHRRRLYLEAMKSCNCVSIPNCRSHCSGWVMCTSNKDVLDRILCTGTADAFREAIAEKPKSKYIDSGATISPCGQYRYLLWRAWAEGPRAVWIMLNPSTADGDEDDQTIRKCVAFAKRWGLAGIEVVNLFAYRATDPKDLKRAAMGCVPGGPGGSLGVTGGWINDQSIMNSCIDHEMVICAWGNDGNIQGRAAKVLLMLEHDRPPVPTLRALKVTKLNQPGHPLYLSLDLIPFEWNGRASKNSAA